METPKVTEIQTYRAGRNKLYLVPDLAPLPAPIQNVVALEFLPELLELPPVA